MTLVSRDTLRLSELERQAIENDTVPSALLLEMIKAYSELKERSDAAALVADQRRRFERLTISAWVSAGRGPMTRVHAFGSSYAWPGDPDDVFTVLQHVGFEASLQILQSTGSAHRETMVVVDAECDASTGTDAKEGRTP